MNPKRILLHNSLSPGDIVMLTAAIRDLHQTNPGEYETGIICPRMDLWENNPYVTPMDPKDPTVTEMETHYPLIERSNDLPYHFINGYRKYVAEILKVRIAQGPHHGDIYMTSQERETASPVEQATGSDQPYWVVVNGGKKDFTAKWWHPKWMQTVVGHFPKTRFVQTGLSEHGHPKLTGKNILDLTDCMGRDYIRLIYHAQGVITPVSFAMHLAAAVPRKGNRLKPCVVIAGGRESVTWEGYPGHQYLHTIGCLPCCADGGCWRSRVIPLGDGSENDKPDNLCLAPVLRSGIAIPTCMDMITPNDVISAIRKSMEYA